MARLNSAVTTNRNNGQLNATYNYKKSEWTFNYGGMFRKSKDEITNITETFIGRDNPVVREQEGQPSKTKDFDNNFSLDYVYMHDPQTMLAATLSYNYHDNERDGNYRMIERMVRSQKNITSFSTIIIRGIHLLWVCISARHSNITNE